MLNKTSRRSNSSYSTPIILLARLNSPFVLVSQKDLLQPFGDSWYLMKQSHRWQLGVMKMIGIILTLLRSSAASSFFWMSSRERSLFGGLVTQWATSDTGEDGFRMTSKAWPEARLLMGLMSMSACACSKEKERKDSV